MERFKVWLRNTSHIHHRIMAKFIRKRGWVAFYLEPQYRYCGKDFCWLKLYESEEK